MLPRASFQTPLAGLRPAGGGRFKRPQDTGGKDRRRYQVGLTELENVKTPAGVFQTALDRPGGRSRRNSAMRVASVWTAPRAEPRASKPCVPPTALKNPLLHSARNSVE